MKKVLSRRLLKVASFVEEGSRVADIGTDHGYVPIWLVQNGIISYGLAMDIGEGPLSRAREHIAQAGLSEQIQTRKSDGLEHLKPQEVDTVVIAGMGGELMIQILNRGRERWEDVKTWIFSPQSELDKFRRFLETDFQVTREEVVEEEGKYYWIMKAVRNKPVSKQPVYPAWYYDYGRLPIIAKDPVLLQYLKKEEITLSAILKTIDQSRTLSGKSRRAQVAEQLKRNQEAQNEMLGNYENNRKKDSPYFGL